VRRLLVAVSALLLGTGAVVAIPATPAWAACSISIVPHGNPTNRSNTINRGGCVVVSAAHTWAQPCNGCYGVTNWVHHPTSAWSPTRSYLVQGLGSGG
jgi:hypothetical protein